MKRYAVIISPYPLGPEYEHSRHWTRRGAVRAEKQVVFSDDEAIVFIRRIY